MRQSSVAAPSLKLLHQIVDRLLESGRQPIEFNDVFEDLSRAEQVEVTEAQEFVRVLKERAAAIKAVQAQKEPLAGLVCVLVQSIL